MYRVELFLCVQVSSDFGAGQPVARTIAACFGKITGAPWKLAIEVDDTKALYHQRCCF